MGCIFTKVCQHDEDEEPFDTQLKDAKDKTRRLQQQTKQLLHDSTQKSDSLDGDSCAPSLARPSYERVYIGGGIPGTALDAQRAEDPTYTGAGDKGGFTSRSGRIRWGSRSRAGNDPLRRRKENQDCFCVCDGLAQQREMVFFSVFDGHGPEGAFTSHFVRDEYYQCVSESWIKHFGAGSGSSSMLSMLTKHNDVSSISSTRSTSSTASTASTTSTSSIYSTPNSGSSNSSYNINSSGSTISSINSASSSLGSSIREGLSSEFSLPTVEQVFTEAARSVTAKLVNSSIDISVSGCTSVSLLILDKQVFLANVGDSRAIVASFDAASASYALVGETRDHKPELEQEKQRIESQNGRVFEWGSFRVWLQDVDMPGLAMSRSFGDAVAKTVGVIDDPEISQIDSHQLHFGLEDDQGQPQRHPSFCVLASDGLWEFISNEECIELVAECLRDQGVDPQSACDRLVTEALQRWNAEDDVVDDITIVVVFF